MDHLQTYRFVLHLTKRVEELEAALANGGITNTITVPTVDLTDINNRLAALEARPVVDLTDVSNRLGAVEARPELSQRLSALELAVTSLNTTN
jgi:hypothetical protein